MLSAVDPQAEVAGLETGMRLADARALVPGLRVQAADPGADRRGLVRLARWCSRFTPWTTVDGADGLFLDITGCAHLFDGEVPLLDEITRQLTGLGFTVRLGLAGTPGMAWALARFAPTEKRLVASGSEQVSLDPLPVEALRLSPDDAQLLHRLGVATIAELSGLPRASLAHRFGSKGESVLACLDRALGERAEPLSPLMPQPLYQCRMSLPEPILHTDSLRSVLVRLVEQLLVSLEDDRVGLRHLVMWCFRTDGEALHKDVKTAQATRASKHLLRLFDECLETVDAGLGIDHVMLQALRVEPMEDRQISLFGREQTHDDVNRLLDRLHARLGDGAVHRLLPVERHLPEKAERVAAPDHPGRPWPAEPDLPPRPLYLFDRPEAVDAVAEMPDGPPLLFIWRRVRRRVVRAAGPERIAPVWGGKGSVRDYYRVEDSEGRRYWLYRSGVYGDAGSPPCWYVHGLYG